MSSKLDKYLLNGLNPLPDEFLSNPPNRRNVGEILMERNQRNSSAHRLRVSLLKRIEDVTKISEVEIVDAYPVLITVFIIVETDDIEQGIRRNSIVVENIKNIVYDCLLDEDWLVHETTRLMIDIVSLQEVSIKYNGILDLRLDDIRYPLMPT